MMQTFKLEGEAAWIGLRYVCQTRTLQWVSGESHPATGFKAWDAKWDQSVPGAGCLKTGRGWGERPWMPVAYSPVGQGFRWFAMGGAKEYAYYFVEYPTGKP
jgi:hypothetical protein